MAGEVLRARGHPNVTALHKSTFEVTRDRDISTAADCIIAVAADRAAGTLSRQFRDAAARDDARITAAIASGGLSDTVEGWGSARMTFSDGRSLVFRVSDFVDGRTVMIGADKPAARLDRALVAQLAAGEPVEIRLTVRREKRPEPVLDTLFEG